MGKFLQTITIILKFIKNNYMLGIRIILSLLIIYLAYWAEYIVFKLIEFISYLFFFNFYYFDLLFSRGIYLLLNYTFIKFIISILLFPGGFAISKYLSLVQLFENMMINMEYELNYIERNMKHYLTNDKIFHIINFRIQNFSIFQDSLQNFDKINNIEEDCFDLHKFEIKEGIEDLLEEFNKFQIPQYLDNSKIENIIAKVNILKGKFGKYLSKFSFLKFKLKNLLLFFNTRLKSLYKERLEEVIITSHSQELKFYLIHPNVRSNSLMIMCNPNGMCLENFGVYNELIEIYLKNNIAVLIWNYQGYGSRSGRPSFSNIKFDSERIFEYILNRCTNQFEKIGVHGYSMGGLVACHLSKRFEQVSVLIADRTFGAIDNVVKHSIGYNLHYLFNFFFPYKTSYSTISDFINAKTRSKLILYDPKDEIIHSNSSLKQEVTNHMFIKIYYNLLCRYNDTNLLGSNANHSSLIFSNEELEKIKPKMFHIMRYLNKLSLLDEEKDEDINRLKQDIKFINSFFYSFLLGEHSNINLQNFDGKYNNYIHNFIRNLFVWGYSNNSINKKMFNNCNESNSSQTNSPWVHYNYKSIPMILGNFNYQANLLFKSESVVKINEIKEELIDFIKKYLSKLNLIYFRTLFDDNNLYTDDDILKFNYDFEEIVNHIKLKEEISLLLNTNVGHYFELQNGHNGEYTEEEKGIIETYLKFHKFCN